MARNFMQVFEEIKNAAPKNLASALEDKVNFWAPEMCWEMLSEYVNRYLPASSKDATSIAVYALLCNCSEEEMKARFEAADL